MDDLQLESATLAELWHQIVDSCMRVLNHAKIYGFCLMDIPDPNIHDIERNLTILSRLLDELANDAHYIGYQGTKIASLKQYTLHIKAIAIALSEGNRLEFERAIVRLQEEPMIGPS